MAGATGDALDWALALLQAPGQQRVLRRQPLPPGMQRLLAMAAGSPPDQLLQASQAFGEPAPRIQEAARFYVRQVLFHPEADAYRVLGVPADASPAQIKVHYRLLQQWLHPDRLESRDDAVFATRVNQAWQQVRSPERRAAYDEGRSGAPPVPAAAPMAPAAAWVPEPLAEPAGERWRRRAPVLALVAACAVLTVMALRDNGPHPGDPLPDPAEAVASAPRLPGGDEAPQAAPPPAAPVPAAAARRRPASIGAAPAVAPLLVPATFVAEQSLPAVAPPDVAAAEVLAPASASPVPPVPPVPPAAASTAARQPQVRLRGDGSAASSAASAAAAREALRGLPDFGRLDAAQATGQKLLRYLQARQAPAPPIWTSPALLMQAQALRATLRQGPAIRMGVPQWRIGSGEAEMRVRVAREDAGSDQLVAELAWREEQWLVTGLRLEPLS